MSDIRLVVNREALQSASQSIKTFANQCREAIEEAKQGVEHCSSEWSDDDYEGLLVAMSEMQRAFSEIEGNGARLCERIKEKLGAIDMLHSMKI